MSLTRIYGLFLRHFYLITRSFPRILDLVYWPSIQITLWGFISNFFATHTTYYNNAVGVILTCAILYDFLFRTSIGFNMLFLEEIWKMKIPNDFIRFLICFLNIRKMFGTFSEVVFCGRFLNDFYIS